MDTQTINTPEKLHQDIVKFLESNYSHEDLVGTYNDARKCVIRFRGDYSAMPALPACKDNPLDGLQDVMDWCIKSSEIVDNIVFNLERQTIIATISQLKKLRDFPSRVLSIVNSKLKEQAQKEARAKVEKEYKNLNEKELRLKSEKSPLDVMAELYLEEQKILRRETEDAVQIYLSKDLTFKDKLSHLHDEEINEVFETLNKLVGSDTPTGKLIDIYCKLKDIPLQRQFNDVGYAYSLNDLTDVIYSGCNRLYTSVDNVIKTFEEIQTKAEQKADLAKLKPEGTDFQQSRSVDEFIRQHTSSDPHKLPANFKKILAEEINLLHLPVPTPRHPFAVDSDYIQTGMHTGDYILGDLDRAVLRFVFDVAEPVKLEKAALKDWMLNKCGVSLSELKELSWPDISRRLLSALVSTQEEGGQTEEQQLATRIIKDLNNWASVGADNWEEKLPADFRPNHCWWYHFSIHNKLGINPILQKLKLEGKGDAARDIEQLRDTLNKAVNACNENLPDTSPMHLPNTELSIHAANLADALERALPYLGSQPPDLAKVPISELIKQAEGPILEFKETLIYDTKQNRKSDDVLLSSLKTIAGFLNTGGGTLLIGVVNDSGEIKGIERDLRIMKHGNNDRFELKIRNCLKERFKPQPIGKVNISFEKFTEGTICRVDVQANKEIVHLDDEVYVREGNTTQKLEGRSLTDWFQQRGK
jgi:hypothetical protein